MGRVVHPFEKKNQKQEFLCVTVHEKMCVCVCVSLGLYLPCVAGEHLRGMKGSTTQARHPGAPRSGPPPPAGTRRGRQSVS